MIFYFPVIKVITDRIGIAENIDIFISLEIYRYVLLLKLSEAPAVFYPIYHIMKKTAGIGVKNRKFRKISGKLFIVLENFIEYPADHHTIL